MKYLQSNYRFLTNIEFYELIDKDNWIWQPLVNLQLSFVPNLYERIKIAEHTYKIINREYKILKEKPDNTVEYKSSVSIYLEKVNE